MRARGGPARGIACAAALGATAVSLVAAPAHATGSDVADDACRGVAVVVDLGVLPGADGADGADDATVACDPGDGHRSGLDVLDGAGIDVEGTARWGPSFVCRVDGRPTADEVIDLPDGDTLVEACADTPSTQAYWTLWVARAGEDWTYATTGVADLTLYPGDALGLRFGTSSADGSAPASDVAPRVAPEAAFASAASGAGTDNGADDTGSGDVDGVDQGALVVPVPVVVGVVLVLGLVAASVVVARRRRP
ncbi:hypothetical protein CLV28_1558 [Sediminihabitans luteus]|uniref:Uncharacterized protein n=1 Tax=Sediminihabitans luteus TaxID=1138585 RepID=A0A2M9CQ99_9CELL|nr:hypothetical protein [Sediminihabitans luteus]PJJ74069.1 hypothetical protein CLV28_1558 [Sediminihabitans luteus]GII98016.1 hypothetical protein Slu03_03940 [Sediminihabitans luteus]